MILSVASYVPQWYECSTATISDKGNYMVNYLQNKEQKLGLKDNQFAPEESFSILKAIKVTRDVMLILASTHIIYYVWSVL